jgi:hypothetical protein
MRRGALLLVVSAALAPAAPAPAQSGGGIRLDFNSIDGGAGRMSAGPFVLTGVIGQPETAANAPLQGGVFRLQPGVLAGVVAGGPVSDSIFSDSFEATP